MSSILDFIGAKDDGGGGDNWDGTTGRAKLQSHQQTNMQLSTDPSCRPTNSDKAQKAESTHGLAHPRLAWDLSTLSLTWLPWGLPRISPAL